TAAVAGIIIGSINLAIGFMAVQVNPINGCILALGLIMLGTGITAIRKPTLHSLFMEGVVSLLILAWNVSMAIVSARAGQADHVTGHGLIFPLIAALAFFRQYVRLGHLKDTVSALDEGTVK